MRQSCFPKAKLATIAFHSCRKKKLIVDDYGGARPDGNFLLFFIKKDEYIAPKVPIIYLILIRAGGFCTC